MIFVSDMSRSVAFYRDVLGIPLKFESPGWSEFASEGATIALHKSDGPALEPEPKGVETAGRSRPGFEVEDLDAFHTRMVEHGVPCAQEPTPLFGAKIAQYWDPDGLIFAVGQARGGEPPR